MLNGYEIKRRADGHYELLKQGNVVYGAASFIRCAEAYADLTGDRLTTAQMETVFDRCEA